MRWRGEKKETGNPWKQETPGPTYLPAQRLEIARPPPLLLLVFLRLGGEELVDLDVGQDRVLGFDDLHS